MNIIRQYRQQWQGFSKNIKAFLIFDSCNQFSIAIFTLYFPRYLIQLGHQEDLYGSLMGIATVMTAVFSIAAGIVSDRIGRHNSIMISIGISKITYMLRAFVVVIPVLYGAHLAQGIIITLYTSSLVPYIYENSTAEKRVQAFSARAVFVRLANIGGNFLGGILPLVIFKLLPDTNLVNVYRIIFSISLIIAAIGIWQIFKTRPAQRNEKPASVKAKNFFDNIKSLSPQNLRFIVKFSLVYASISFGAGMILPFINTYFLRKFNAGPEATGLVFSLANISVIIGISLAPMIARKLGLERAIVITRLLSLPMFLVMGWATKYWLVAAAYLMRAALQQMSHPLQNNFIMKELNPNTRATANGVFNTASEGFRSIAIFIAGKIIVTSGYSPLFLISLAFYSTSVLLFYKFFFFVEKKSELNPRPETKADM